MADFYGNKARIGNDRKMDALNFIMCARPAVLATMTAADIATRYNVPAEFARDLLAKRRQQGLGL